MTQYAQLSDLYEEINKAADRIGCDDLIVAKAQGKFTDKEIRTFSKYARDIINLGQRKLLDDEPFAGIFAQRVHFYVTYTMRAAFGSNFTGHGLEVKMNVFYNPFAMCYNEGIRSLGTFMLKTDKNGKILKFNANDKNEFHHASALILHELGHLIHDHQHEFEFYDKRGLSDVTNIAEDGAVNQMDYIASDKFIVNQGISYANLLKLVGSKAKIKPKDSAMHYLEPVYLAKKHQIDFMRNFQQGMKDGMAQAQQAQGNGQQQNQNTSSQSQSGQNGQQQAGSQQQTGNQQQAGQSNNQPQSGQQNGQGQSGSQTTVNQPQNGQNDQQQSGSQQRVGQFGSQTNGQSQFGSQQNGQGQSGSQITQNGQQNGQSQSGNQANGNQPQNGQQNGQGQSGSQMNSNQTQSGQQSGQGQTGSQMNGNQTQNGSQNGQNQTGNQANGNQQQTGSQNGQGQSGNQNGNQPQTANSQQGQKTPSNIDKNSDAYKAGYELGKSSANPANSHSVWKQSPSDVEGTKGDTTVNSDAVNGQLIPAIRDAMQKAKTSPEALKQRGLISGNMADQLLNGEATLRHQIPISRVITQGAGKLRYGIRKTYHKPSHLQSNRIDVRKGKTKIVNKNLHVFVDCSGSMSEDDINWALAEIALVARRTKTKVTVIPFDAEVYVDAATTISRHGKFDFTPTGRGGTLVQPCFDYLKEIHATSNASNAAIILTDGYVEDHVDTYGLHNVVWILVNSDTDTLAVKDPIGSVGYLSNDGDYKLHKMSQR